MKTTSTLPAKKTRTVGIFKDKNQPGPDSTSTTDTTSLFTVSTTHLFNR